MNDYIRKSQNRHLEQVTGMPNRCGEKCSHGSGHQEGFATVANVRRWVQVPVGLVLGLLTVLCGFNSVILLLAPNKKSPILAIVG
jgi:hypothetical protein